MRYLLFSRIEGACFNNLRNYSFVSSDFLFRLSAFFSNFLLLVVVIENYWCILLLYFRCETVFVIIPEQVEQLLISNSFWIVVYFDDFSMISSTIVRIISSDEFDESYSLLTNSYKLDYQDFRLNIRLSFSKHLVEHHRDCPTTRNIPFQKLLINDKTKN